MGTFSNVQYKTTINSIVEGYKNKLDNPHYIFTDKKPTLVTYYNINTSCSTLDHGTRTAYEYVGNDSPIKYNKILDMYLYGIERIAINLDMGEYGLESDSIEGEAYILPNTIIPMAQDYFYIDYIDTKKTRLLFKVTSVTHDTVENCANFYKITYKLSYIDKDKTCDIEKQVVETYRLVINNLGTNLNTVIKNTDYDLITDLENILDRLKEYYKSLFFKDKVQTFVFEYDDDYFYDPFMIEFIRRNGILSGMEKYLHVSHQTSLENTFFLDYDRTFFRAIELKDSNSMNAFIAYAKRNISKFTLMYHRPETYFIMQYYNDMGPLAFQINPLPVGYEEYIKNNKYYEGDFEYLNIITKYFNGDTIDTNVIDILNKTKFFPCIHIFYAIPIIIFVLQNSINSIMSDKNNI